jgi:hypothetical protein
MPASRTSVASAVSLLLLLGLLEKVLLVSFLEEVSGAR